MPLDKVWKGNNRSKEQKDNFWGLSDLLLRDSAFYTEIVKNPFKNNLSKFWNLISKKIS